MSTTDSGRGALESLAAERRAALGDDLPSAEQLIALRDGELPEDEAETVREHLAVDPELTELYLALCRAGEDAEQEPSGEPSPEVVEARLRELLKTESSPHPAVSDKVVPFPGGRRTPRNASLGVAALLVAAVALLFLSPGAAYQQVVVPSDDLRGPEKVSLTDEDGGLEFVVSAATLEARGLDPDRPFDAELRDENGRSVKTRLGLSASASSPAAFRVKRSQLEGLRVLELYLRSSSGSEDGRWTRVHAVELHEAP